MRKLQEQYDYFSMLFAYSFVKNWGITGNFVKLCGDLM